jgi:hypothetical protein
MFAEQRFPTIKEKTSRTGDGSPERWGFFECGTLFPFWRSDLIWIQPCYAHLKIWSVGSVLLYPPCHHAINIPLWA